MGYEKVVPKVAERGLLWVDGLADEKVVKLVVYLAV
jgi:hypothetical protein